MKSTLDQVEAIKANGYSLDFSNVFNHAFENYKKIALYAGLIILVFSILFFIGFTFIVGAYYGAESLNEEFFKNLGVQKLSSVQLLASTFIISFLSALLSPFGAGFLKMADSADKDNEFNVSTIFSYYQPPYFSQLFISAFILALVGSAITNTLESLGLGILGSIISLIISFFTILTIPLIVFGNLKALDAIKSSVIVVSKNPFVLLALVITGILGSFVGVIGCCIGVVFTIAFNTSMSYAMYCAIFDIEEDDSIDSIGTSYSE